MAKKRAHKNQLTLFSEEALHPFTELDSARESALKCQKCALHSTRTHVVFGDGNPERPPVMFVGEAPGEKEDLSGEPFVGRSGKLLDKMIDSMDLERVEVYVCNVICCRPPKNRKPELQEIAQCAHNLVRQIRVVKPRVIVALGATAANTLLGKNQKVGKMRGKWFEWEKVPVRVTFHPSYLLREPHAKKDAHTDLKAIKAKIDETGAKNG